MSEQYIQICQNIQPKDLLCYLKRIGDIRKIADYRDNCTVYEVNSKRFLIPNHMELDDYASAVGSIVQRISQMQGRSFDDVLEALSLASVDLLSFRNICDSTSDGTIPLWQCQNFVQGASDMVSAIACSAYSQKRCYSGKKPQDADEYFRNVRFGQTKVGSFIINLKCPITQEFSPSLFDDEEPYFNRVLPLLDKALESALGLAQKALTQDDISELINHPELGLSSNFYDALILLHESTNDGSFEITTTPAIHRKRPFAPKQHCYNGDLMECFKEASKQIKASEPLQDQTVCGPVTHIDQNPDADFKSVTIRDITSAKPRDILICLKDDDYDRLFPKFQKDIIRVTGTLNISRGKKPKIQEYTSLEIVEATSDSDA